MECVSVLARALLTALRSVSDPFGVRCVDFPFTAGIDIASILSALIPGQRTSRPGDYGEARELYDSGMRCRI